MSSASVFMNFTKSPFDQLNCHISYLRLPFYQYKKVPFEKLQYFSSNGIYIQKTTNVVSGTIQCSKHCMITHDNSSLLHPGKAEYETNGPKPVFAISNKHIYTL